MASTSVLGIDCRFASTHSGLGTYTRGLVTALIRKAPEISYVLFVRSANEAWLQSFPHKNVHIVVANFPHYSVREQILFPRLIRRSGCSLFFAPQFNVPLLCPIPFVCTVHDLILHHFPNEAGIIKRMAYRFLLWCSLRRSALVLTVSDATKTDLLSYYPFVRDKVCTVYPGIDTTPLLDAQSSVAYTLQKYRLTLPYFLYVGNCKEHKNVPLLVQSFVSLGLSSHLLVLVCDGSVCDSLTVSDSVRRLSNLDANDLTSLYSGATAVVTATLMEGFGLPVLEAMMHHSPVIASDVPSIREISGGHTILVSPTVSAFQRALLHVIDTPPERTHLDSASLHAGTFSWDRSVEQVLQRLRPLL